MRARLAPTAFLVVAVFAAATIAAAQPACPVCGPSCSTVASCCTTCPLHGTSATTADAAVLAAIEARIDAGRRVPLSPISDVHGRMVASGLDWPASDLGRPPAPGWPDEVLRHQSGTGWENLYWVFEGGPYASRTAATPTHAARERLGALAAVCMDAAALAETIRDPALRARALSMVAKRLGEMTFDVRPTLGLPGNPKPTAGDPEFEALWDETAKKYLAVFTSAQQEADAVYAVALAKAARGLFARAVEDAVEAVGAAWRGAAVSAFDAEVRLLKHEAQAAIAQAISDQTAMQRASAAFGQATAKAADVFTTSMAEASSREEATLAAVKALEDARMSAHQALRKALEQIEDACFADAVRHARSALASEIAFQAPTNRRQIEMKQFAADRFAVAAQAAQAAFAQAAAAQRSGQSEVGPFGPAQRAFAEAVNSTAYPEDVTPEDRAYAAGPLGKAVDAMWSATTQSESCFATIREISLSCMDATMDQAATALEETLELAESRDEAIALAEQAFEESLEQAANAFVDAMPEATVGPVEEGVEATEITRVLAGLDAANTAYSGAISTGARGDQAARNARDAFMSVVPTEAPKRYLDAAYAQTHAALEGALTRSQARDAALADEAEALRELLAQAAAAYQNQVQAAALTEVKTAIAASDKAAADARDAGKSHRQAAKAAEEAFGTALAKLASKCGGITSAAAKAAQGVVSTAGADLEAALRAGWPPLPAATAPPSDYAAGYYVETTSAELGRAVDAAGAAIPVTAEALLSFDDIMSGVAPALGCRNVALLAVAQDAACLAAYALTTYMPVDLGFFKSTPAGLESDWGELAKGLSPLVSFVTGTLNMMTFCGRADALAAPRVPPTPGMVGRPCCGNNDLARNLAFAAPSLATTVAQAYAPELAPTIAGYIKGSGFDTPPLPSEIVTLVGSGRCGTAAAMLDRYIRGLPTSAPAHYYRALALYDLGKWRQAEDGTVLRGDLLALAIRSAEVALALKPSSEPARAILAKCKNLLGHDVPTYATAGGLTRDY